MKVLDLRSQALSPIVAFESSGASSVELAAGQGEAHVHTVRIQAGGIIGAHEAGFGQLFVVLSGLGWAAGPGGERCRLEPGQAAFIRRGETHSKGAESDMVAVIVQVGQLELEADERRR
jgi:quercetin dioxygenase-like cupin family protein